ncbi:adult-specific rigid cuticular protein 15.7-like [Argiope bruennichi]|uniref:Adult-specific rigid cuticular protein 15.5 like protein n=1 Tax=Argiope bruennichi TaxID=94029 RepID=A0A8T0EHG8_ARGBR|nr:adult-specific rigid cuticular protein 15.7-like [Argiope bruennichi]KAF8773337.1 Adult-specific rigid cuticular protein 15.5 like protein [Argiope bruennichi]
MFLLTVLACISLSQASHLLYNAYPYARPYQAGYYVREPHRHEHAEVVRDHGGAVAGRYGYLDASGIGRQVHYVADHAGLRAKVHTNEPAVVRNAPLAAGIVSDGLLARGVAAAVPSYNPALGYDYGLNPYGLAYNRLGLGYGYGSALGYTGLLGSYPSLYA